jgi:4-alpha-glucanotransferase
MVIPERAAGVLLHPTSLPPPGGLEGALAFVRWLADAGVRYWQVLPLGIPGPGGCPYTSPASTGLDPGLGSPGVDASLHEELEDLALFLAISRAQDCRPWSRWPGPLRRREPAALAEAHQQLGPAIAAELEAQGRAHAGWAVVRDEARRLGVRIVSDLPIYVGQASFDTWCRPELFDLDRVSGVPPDAYSDTGQLWGHPLYHWPAHAQEGYRWWVARVAAALAHADVLRIDHFRGLVAYWAVPAGARDARVGHWLPGPGKALFDALGAALGDIPVIVEDLGYIDPPVVALREELGLMGMRIAQFGFGPAGDPTHLPEQCPQHAVAYTGTHDNDTALGFYRSAPPAVRAHVRRVVGLRQPIAWGLIERVFDSRARLAVAPLQDLLGLGSEARMNTPGTVEGNWRWRAPPECLTRHLASQVRQLAAAAGRAM